MTPIGRRGRYLRPVFSALVFTAAVRMFAGEVPEGRGLDPPVPLPDGREVLTWEEEPVFTQTYHVNASHPDADDGNPGTAARPWRTIGRAARELGPGAPVLVFGEARADGPPPVDR